MTKFQKAILNIPVFLAIIVAGPWVYSFFALPSESEMAERLDNEEVTTEMLCLACLPNPIHSGKCNQTMARFIAVDMKAATANSRKITIAFLAGSIQLKYDDETTAKLYFSHLAQSFHLENITNLCEQRFSKKCSDLSMSELMSFQNGITSGSFTEPPESIKQTYQTCF